MLDATATKPAFIGIQHYGHAVLFRIGNHDIAAANIDALFTANAFFGINSDGLSRAADIWN